MKMKSFLVTILAVVLLIGTTYAQGKRDAELMVKKAITYYRSVGKDKALLDFCDKKGKFVDGELYITVYDLEGKCLANGGDLKLLGKNQVELKDADGKAFIKERLEIVKNQITGWQTYKWKNPESKQIETKTTYVEKAEGVIFACGTYRSK
jgi:cytochrome c